MTRKGIVGDGILPPETPPFWCPQPMNVALHVAKGRGYVREFQMGDDPDVMPKAPAEGRQGPESGKGQERPRSGPRARGP